MNENDPKYMRKPSPMDLLLGPEFLNVPLPAPPVVIPVQDLPYPAMAGGEFGPAVAAIAPAAPSLAQAVAAAVDPVHRPPRRCLWKGTPLGAFPDPIPEKDNPNALFCAGWLRKGGGAFIVAPSGVGKSVLSMQCAMSWAIGESFFGVTPVRPLKIVIVQAEDDNEEISFFRNQIRHGLIEEYKFDPEALRLAMGQSMDDPNAKIIFFKAVGETGESFVGGLGALLDAQPDIDLVIVNPFQSYFGDDCSKNAALSQFLRTWLDREIKDPGDNGKDRAAVMFVHHTNKPPADKDERAGWGVDMFAAYIGAGGAEIVNWARAILSLMPTKIHGCFRLCAGKRGQRLGWEDVATGKPTYTKIIKHADNGNVYWRPASAEDEAELRPADKKAGKDGAVGGNGNGGIPPRNKARFTMLSAVSCVDAEPGHTGNYYREKMCENVGCSSEKGRLLLEAATEVGLLSCTEDGRAKIYNVTAAGKADLDKVAF